MAQDKSQIKEVKAFARYIRISPRKLRLVADLVRKAPVERALEQLKFSSKNGALPVSKVINSAIANAVHNFNLDRTTLYIKSITVDGGPVYKRYAPRAQGRAFIERKRTSHINVVLESRSTGGKKAKRSVLTQQAAAKHEHKHEQHDAESAAPESSSKPTAPKQAPKSSEKVKQQKVGLKRRLFNRKSGQ